MDGYEAVRRIRTAKNGGKAILVALTADAFEEDRTCVMQAGFDGFIRKPYREEDLLLQIGKHLDAKYEWVELTNEYKSVDNGEETFSLQFVSEEWKERLRKAAIIADADEVMHLIGEIEDQHPIAAERLLRWAGHFRFDRIRLAAEEGSEQHGQ